MEQLTHWLPTITTACVVVGVAFVADSNLKRHETVISTLVGKVQSLETKVAVIEAKMEKE